MQVATGEVPKAYARQGGWRISVDRAWRSRQMRQTFEADTGTAPLDSTDERRNASGETAAYYENFLLWATRYLRLEDRKSVVQGKSVSVRVYLGGRRFI